MFGELTSQSMISSECLTRPFVEKMIALVNGGSQIEKRVLISALIVLEDILVTGCDWAVRLIDAELPLPNLLSLLQCRTNELDSAIQHNCVALMNALFAKADSLRRKAIVRTLSSKQFRTVLLNNILNRTIDTSIGCEMAHQLYVLQSNLWNIHFERTRQFDEREAADKCAQLCRLAFENEFSFPSDNRSRVTSAYNADDPVVVGAGRDEQTDNCVKLGFTNPSQPALDFQDEPKMLSLDLMLYFALNYTDNYIKVVFENCSRADKEYECPFVRSSIEITKLLVKTVSLGEPPRDEGQTYHMLFFTHDHPLEELFSICVPLLNKTWKEMRATVEDFAKVFSVLRQQLIEAFKSKEDTSSFEQLRKRLSSLTYSEILNIWQRERNSREEWENNAASILELRAMITPNMAEVVKQHRIQFLTDGTRFVKYSNKGDLFHIFHNCNLSKMVSNQSCFQPSNRSTVEGQILVLSTFKQVKSAILR
jgi:engulfment/cell motility protein 1